MIDKSAESNLLPYFMQRDEIIRFLISNPSS